MREAFLREESAGCLSGPDFCRVQRVGGGARVRGERGVVGQMRRVGGGGGGGRKRGSPGPLRPRVWNLEHPRNAGGLVKRPARPGACRGSALPGLLCRAGQPGEQHECVAEAAL